MSFLNSIEKKSKKFESPFTHWELNEPLTEEQVNEIVKADIANPTEYNLNYDGTRAIDGGEGKFREGISDGGKALKFRCFITKENSNQFPNLTNFIQELQNKKTYEKISSLIGKDLSTKSKHEISFSLISQCGFNQKPFRSHITSTLTYELD